MERVSEMLIGRYNTRPDQRRQSNDWYVDPPWCSAALFRMHRFRAKGVYDPCCGQGNILTAAEEAGYRVMGSDLVRRWSNDKDWRTRDFLDARDDHVDIIPCRGAPPPPAHRQSSPLGVKQGRTLPVSAAIVMNPPYKLAGAFIERALRETEEVAVIVPASFLYSQTRYPCFSGEHRWPLIKIIHLSTRPSMPPGASGLPAKGGKTDYCWLVFDKTTKPTSPKTYWALR